MDKIQKGLLFFEQSQRILQKDFNRAFDDQDWNIAIRRAQESMELAVKGTFLITGEKPSKTHSPVLRTLYREFIPGKSPTPFGQEYDLVLEGESFRIQRDSLTGALLIFKKVNGVLTEIAQAGSAAPEEFQPFGLAVKDNAVKILQGGQEIASTTERLLIITTNQGDRYTLNLGGLGSLPKLEIRQIDRYVSKQSKQRSATFFLDKPCN